MTQNTWNIDTTHSAIGFAVRHMVVSKTRGHFGKYTGKVQLGEDLSRSSVEVTIDAASIDTGTPERDAHLRSADFFDVERFPALTFASRRIEKLDEERYRMTGDLTIRDVTREVTVEVEYGGQRKDPWGNVRAGFAARTAVDRKDFGLHWNQVLEAGGLLVGDRVEIEIELELVRAAAQNAA